MKDVELNSDTLKLLDQFRDAESVATQWSAARLMMAAKTLPAIIDRQEFNEGLSQLGRVARDGLGLERLLAIELVVRISSYAKKIKPKAQELLKSALGQELPPMSLASETKDLPEQAKPAEVRENVAAALSYAAGDWVKPYILASFVTEDRSQRCRTELLKQLVARDAQIDHWLSYLVEQNWGSLLNTSSVDDTGLARLSEIATALSETIRKERRKVQLTQDTGPLIASLCSKLGLVRSGRTLPKRLADASANSLILVDEIVTAKLALLIEPDTYAALSVVRRWWEPLPYPASVKKLSDPLVDKLISGITLRAKLGQRSDGLAKRLREAIGDPAETKSKLANIAASEVGLDGDIEDWLRGIERTNTSTIGSASALEDISNRNVDELFAPLLIESLSIQESAEAPQNEHLARLLRLIGQITRERDLQVLGVMGDIVEFSPALYETLDGMPPKEIRVKVVQPPVIRRRKTGGQDVVLRGRVTTA